MVVWVMDRPSLGILGGSARPVVGATGVTVPPKELVRPRLVRRPAVKGQCWALMSLGGEARQGILPCTRRARLTHWTCGLHRDWESAAQEEAMLLDAEVRR
jgi:hypothetical protein